MSLDGWALMFVLVVGGGLIGTGVTVLSRFVLWVADMFRGA
jgi:hypothetical protein